MSLRKSDKREIVGILGGTFNPIHHGHLILASFAYDTFNLSKVLFVPNRVPPHKTPEDIASPEDRLNMVKLAIEDDPRFLVSDIEIAREGVSYTFHTLRALKERYPKLAFICGKDALLRSKWYNLDGIMELLDLMIVADRLSPTPSPDLLSELAKHPVLGRFTQKIAILPIPLIQISSSMIRERIRKGLSVRYLIPRKVEEYIFSKGLYFPRELAKREP